MTEGATYRDELEQDRHPAGKITVYVASADPLADRLIARCEGGPQSARVAPGAGLAETACALDAVVLVPPRSTPGEELLDGLRATLASAPARGARHWLLLSSAEVHTPSHHHPGMVGEGHKGRGSRVESQNPISAAWHRLEEAVRELLPDTTRLTVLRPVMTPVPGGTDLASRLFARRWAWVPVGFDPSLQLLAVEELAAAVDAAIEAPPGGKRVLHVAPREPVPLRRALAHAGVRSLSVPGLLLEALTEPGRANFLRYPFTVSPVRLERTLGAAPSIPSARVAEAAGIAAGRVRRAAETLPQYDSHGLDEGYIRRLGRHFFRFLHDLWWRVEVRGFEHVPKAGKAVLVGVHRGHQPWDGVMTLHLTQRRIGRFPRFLIHPTLVKFPFLAPYMIRCGGLHACRKNGDRVLEQGDILAIFPEGVRGAFTMYKDAYKLGRFGRDEYVKLALRHGAPIVPFVIVGSAEIFPIFGRIDSPWWRRVSEWPYLPITPTMSTVPLPSKWHSWFLEPISVEGYGPEAAEDPEIVRTLSAQVRARMQRAMDLMRDRRPAIFWGSVFDRVSEQDLDHAVQPSTAEGASLIGAGGAS